jgi:hypothetical protein
MAESATPAWQANIDRGARDRAERLVEEAVQVLMRDTSVSPQDQDDPRLRAEIAIRWIAHVLGEFCEGYELPADLKAALWDVANGSEVPLPQWLRREWQRN